VASADPLKDVLAEFANWVYPMKRDNMSLIPGQPTMLLMYGYASFTRWNELGQLVHRDAGLVKLFPPEGSTKDRFVYRSVGGIGVTNPFNVAGTLCEAAWLTCQQKLQTTPTVEQFVAEVDDCLDRLRKAASGERVMSPVKVGLAGVKLPESRNEIVLPWCRIRPAEEHDFPSMMPHPDNDGEIRTTDSAGNTVSVSYRGDLVAEFELPCEFRFADYVSGADLVDREPWPTQLDPTAADSHASVKPVDCIRSGLALAQVVSIGSMIETWRSEVDPLEGFGCSVRFAHSRRSQVFPNQLSEADVDRWTEWMQRAWTFYDNIPIAITRLLRAVSEVKPRPEDTLIDAVIVWENIFGAPQESTMRITMAMARVLAATEEERRERWEELKKIYTLRSDIVHGNEKFRKLTPSQVYATAAKAVPISVELLRAVMQSHPNLLTEYKNGADRSSAVLLS
jgi:Apea-like HEPN